VVALTHADPPGETTHWTAAAMTQAASISVSSVQRIWRGHSLQPHRVRQFKLSNDPAFAAKLRDGFPSNLFDGCPGGRALRRSTGSCRGAPPRRKVADPGAHPNAGPVADEAGSHPCSPVRLRSGQSAAFRLTGAPSPSVSTRCTEGRHSACPSLPGDAAASCVRGRGGQQSRRSWSGPHPAQVRSGARRWPHLSINSGALQPRCRCALRDVGLPQ